MLSDWFMRPSWLWLMLLLPLLILLAQRLGTSQQAWDRVVDKALRPHVLQSSESGSGQVIMLVLVGLAWLAATMALAGPKGHEQEVATGRTTDKLIVLLDLSRSMDIADVTPTRLARAKLKLKDLLQRRPSGETALIVYSANAFTVVPLTEDADTIDVLVTSLATDIMPSRGSYPASAIDKANLLLEQAGGSFGRVLLIGDDAGDETTLAAAQRLRAAGATLSVLAVGTAAGGPVPDPDGGFIKGRDGRVAVVGVPLRALRSLARTGGGAFSQLTADASDLDRLLGDTGAVTRPATLDDSQQRKTTRATDLGIWFVVLLLPLVALQARRGWLFSWALVGGLLLQPQTVLAFDLDDWFATQDQRAQKHFAAEEYAEAAADFADDQWRAAAAYRDGQFVASAKQLAGIDTADAHYNRGNALARAGQFAAAIEAYDASLKLDPEHADAQYNKRLLEEAREQEDASTDNSKSSDQQGQQGEPQAGDGERGESDETSADPSANARNQSGSDPAAGEESENATGEQRDADAADDAAMAELEQALRDAMEESTDPDEAVQQAAVELSPEERAEQEQEQSEAQLLRLIENDPGALLRRKFFREYRRRGRDQDGRSLWPDNEAEPW